MRPENQAHTRQVAHPEKSIAQGGIIDKWQTSCLSAGSVDWIRGSWDHADFSKEDLPPRGPKMPEHRISIENKYWLDPAGELSQSGLESDIRQCWVWKTINCVDWPEWKLHLFLRSQKWAWNTRVCRRTELTVRIQDWAKASVPGGCCYSGHWSWESLPYQLFCKAFSGDRKSVV